MIQTQDICYAYIDGANLHQGSKTRGGIDYKRFKIRICDKYKVDTVYLFLGYIKGKEALYSELSQQGYVLVFKETLEIEGKVKGNCDAELVIKAVSNVYESLTNKAILVTGDGDFACLIDFFKDKKQNITLLAPNRKYCSYLLKKRNIPIVMLEDVRKKFQVNPK